MLVPYFLVLLIQFQRYTFIYNFGLTTRSQRQANFVIRQFGGKSRHWALIQSIASPNVARDINISGPCSNIQCPDFLSILVP